MIIRHLHRSFALFSLAVMVFFGWFILPVHAQDNLKSGDAINLPKDAVVNTNYFAAGKNIVVSGTINGDAYLAGGNIVIEGTVNGDVLAAGGSITIKGTVTQDVRVAGGQIDVSGTIGKNLTVAGGTVTVAEGAKITGSMVSGAGNLSVFAPIPGDLHMGVGNATIANAVGGNIQAGVGTLHLTSEATVSGNLSYWSDEQATIDSGATVVKETQFHKTQHTLENDSDRREADGSVFRGFQIANLLSSLLIGILLMLGAPIFFQKMATQTMQAPWKSLGIGFLILIGTPIVIILMMVTIIGLPLAFITLAGYILLVYFAKIATSVILGQLVSQWFGKKTSIVWVFITGFVVYSLLQFIPIISVFASIVSILLGVGALTRQKYVTYTTLREKKMI